MLCAVWREEAQEIRTQDAAVLQSAVRVAARVLLPFCPSDLARFTRHRLMRKTRSLDRVHFSCTYYVRYSLTVSYDSRCSAYATRAYVRELNSIKKLQNCAANYLPFRITSLSALLERNSDTESQRVDSRLILAAADDVEENNH